MISQTAEYALRSVVCLAAQPDTPLTTPQIGQVTQVPVSYLAKVLQALGKAGIVRSQRGLHGGFVLSRDPQSLNLLDVVHAVDPVHRIERCPLNRGEHGMRLCPLHRRINEAVATLEDAFRQTTVAELVDESRPSLCETSENG